MRVPIFPLDNVVLFPKVQVPLYIFEPRYRQMTSAALEGDRRIGMVVVEPRHRDAMSGDPPVFPVGCLGEIGHSQPHPDGTFHLILQGTQRFRIEAEIPKGGDREYRIAEVELLPEPDEPSNGSLDAERRRVLEMMCRIVPDRADAFREEVFAKLDDATFMNAFCQSLDFSAIEKQQLIEANTVRDRCERLLALMEFHLAAQARHSSSGPETVH